MPIEVRRFGIGHRRADGPPGSTGVTGAVIHSDARGVLAELAFVRGGRLEPHANLNTTYFTVIEGGGWVLVGEEELRVAAGESVVWPAGVVHGAWTDYAEMRAIVAEFTGPDDGWVSGVIEGWAVPASLGPGPVARADGELASRPVDPSTHDRSEGEPL